MVRIKAGFYTTFRTVDKPVCEGLKSAFRGDHRTRCGTDELVVCPSPIAASTSFTKLQRPLGIIVVLGSILDRAARRGSWSRAFGPADRCADFRQRHPHAALDALGAAHGAAPGSTKSLLLAARAN